MPTLQDLNDRLLGLIADHEAACDCLNDAEGDDRDFHEEEVADIELEIERIEELIETGDFERHEDDEDHDVTPTNFEEHKLWL